jgi:hypothetical protein
LQQAVDFFESKVGQAAVAFRLRYEKDTMDAIAKGKQGVDEKPKYPREIQKALDAFGRRQPEGTLLSMTLRHASRS